MLDIEQAAGPAQRFLDERAEPGDVPLALVAGGRPQVGSVFYFDCQSVACLRSGDFRAFPSRVRVGSARADGTAQVIRSLDDTACRVVLSCAESTT